MTQLPVPTAPARAPLRRQPDGRVIAGVAAGLAGHLGVRVAHVRLAEVQERLRDALSGKWHGFDTE